MRGSLNKVPPPTATMFSASDDKIARWNKYKSRMDDAGVQVIRKFLHLVRPTEGFPASSPYEIERSFNEWKEEEECFYRMTSNDRAPQRVFPKQPAADAPRSCWRMWGLLIQQQVERIDQSELIKLCVADILASPPCRQAECPCKVSNNPWTSYHEVAALDVLNVGHNPRCQCAGYQRCAKKEQAVAMAAAAREASIKATAEAAKAESGGFPYEFCHCGDTQYRACTCGKPAKEAVEYAKKLDAQGKLTPPLAEMLCGKGWTKPVPGDEAQAKPKSCVDCANSFRGKCVECHVKENSYDEKGFLKMPSVLQSMRQAYHMEEQWYANSRGPVNEAKQKAHVPNCACGVCFWEREGQVPESSPRPAVSSGATSPIGALFQQAQKALASSGGSGDMAKDIFASMGTPFDSKCPHGLPFYACMPCSH